MTVQSVTLSLPESLYGYARRVAEATQQPLETVLERSIARSLPPLDDVDAEEAHELLAMAALEDADLWQVARLSLSEADQERLSQLLEQQSTGELDDSQRQELQGLMDEYGRQLTRQAHAYLLLARRGYHVPMQDNTG